MAVPTVMYDANVLYPAPLRDLLIRIAMTGLVRARWTDAIHARATLILTLNARDFPRHALAPHNVTTRHPDDFLADLFDAHPDAICDAARAQRAALTSPMRSPEEFLETCGLSG